MPKRTPKTFSEIIELWPSPSCPELAKDLKLENDTVYHWYHRNSIPAKNWKQIISAGKKRRIEISPSLLVELAAV